MTNLNNDIEYIATKILHNGRPSGLYIQLVRNSAHRRQIFVSLDRRVMSIIPILDKITKYSNRISNSKP